MLKDDAEYFASLFDSAKTPEICKIAVKKCLSNMKYVPETLKTKEFCDYAFNCHAEAIIGIPDQFKTPKMCEQAIEKGAWIYPHMMEEIVASIPGNMLTRDLCLKALNRCGTALKSIPEKLRTFELCWTAVSQDPSALAFVPTELRSKIIEGKLKYIPVWNSEIEKMTRKGEYF